MARSRLNPDAAAFVPAAIQQVEDFSPEWWHLVTTSAWYHDYWISQNQGEDGFYDNGESDADVTDLLPEPFDLDTVDGFFDDSEFDPEEFESMLYHPSSDMGPDSTDL